jgi:hypothetical protein
MPESHLLLKKMTKRKKKFRKTEKARPYQIVQLETNLAKRGPGLEE